MFLDICKVEVNINLILLLRREWTISNRSYRCVGVLMKHENGSWFFLFEPQKLTQTGTHHVGQYLFQVYNKDLSDSNSNCSLAKWLSVALRIKWL